MVSTMAEIHEGRRVGSTHARALIGALTSEFAVGQIIGPNPSLWWTFARMFPEVLVPVAERSYSPRAKRRTNFFKHMRR